jgi:dihydroxyacetone kinase
MKKIINDPVNVVSEMCNGIVMAHGELEFIQKYKVIKKKEINLNKVSLISGGGSGHEPAHAGFVGKGMLDAAVCGDVFASPSQVQIYQGIKATAGHKGTLLIIKNYSGDVMNFKNAAYLASEDGLDVDFVCVDDDIAVQDSLYTVGRRGVAGTVFVHKVAGAAAERGQSLAQVKAVAEKVIKNVRSIGFALTSCTVPVAGKPTFDLGKSEIEYGVGIHGEPGIQREETKTSHVLADRMTKAILDDLGIIPGNDKEVAVMVNGFGGTPLQELYLLNNDVMSALHEAGIKVRGIFVGNYMTSLDMEGASLSILKLDEEMTELLFDESTAVGFRVSGKPELVEYQPVSLEANSEEEISTCKLDPAWANIEPNNLTLDNMKYIVNQMSDIIIKNEVEFCELDSHAGDGDFGMSISKGFRQLKREWAYITRPEITTIGEFLAECSLIIMEHCGGASGPIWGSAFRSAGFAAGAKPAVTVMEFAEMIQAAVRGIQSTGKRSFGRGAIVGDKTLIDALVPCADVWSSESVKGTDFVTIFKKGAEAAVAGAETTKEIVARMGRAGTVGERSIGYPDAGAYGLGVIFTEIAQSLKS